MAKGDKIKLTFEEVVCSETNKKMKRLTPSNIFSHHPYFYNKIFTNNGKKMIFASLLDGKRNYYLLILDSEEAIQITEGDLVDDFGGTLSHDDKYFYYVRDHNVMRIDMLNFEEELVYAKIPGMITGGPQNLSVDGEYMIMTQQSVDDLVKGYDDPWRAFIAQGKIGLRSKLVLYHIPTKTETILLDTKDYPVEGVMKNQWLTHPLIRPYHNEFISYCHEGLGGTVDARIWFTDMNGSKFTCARPHDFEGQIISHEFWFKNGSKMGYVRIDEPDVFKDGMICMINPETLEEEVIVTLPRCSHFITSWDDKMIVADGAMPDKQFMTPELVPDDEKVKPEDLFIYLVDIEKKEYQKLVAHKSSFKNYGHNQDTHPHPCFTPDNKNVIFTSDFEGMPAVYMVEV